MQPYMPYIWIALAVLMAIVEAGTVQLVSVWFVIGALSAAVTTIFTDNIIIQCVVFVTVSLIALLVTRPIISRIKKNRQVLETNARRLIGETGIMLTAVESVVSVGQAKVMGETWTVRCDAPPLENGDKIRVLAIEGVKLIVEKI